MTLSVTEIVELKQLEKEVSNLEFALATAEQEVELHKCKSDLWYWLQNYCFTLDEKDIQNPIKQYPNYPYLKDFADLWMAYPHVRFIAWEKTRRVLGTLSVVAALTWDAQFFDGRQNIIVSQNAPKAEIQIKRRAKIFYENQPDWMKRIYPARFLEGKAIWPGREDNPKSNKTATSLIWSVPQLNEQVRGETPSNLFMDEVAAQTEAESNYHAAAPAMEAGVLWGPRMILVSTAAQGFFDKLVHDRL